MPNPTDVLAYVKPNVLSPEVVGDGVAHAIRGLRDGTLSVVDFRFIMAMEGRVFGANVGSLTTQIAGHTAATFNQLQPDLNLDVLSGITIIPIPPNIYLETSAGTLNRIIVSSLGQLMGDGTSSAVTSGPTNVRSDRKFGSTVRARQAYTANGNSIAPTASQIEHWRAGYPFADATGAPIKQFAPAGEQWPWPVLVGPASYQIYFFGTTTAPTGVIEQHWMEFGSERFI